MTVILSQPQCVNHKSSWSSGGHPVNMNPLTTWPLGLPDHTPAPISLILVPNHQTNLAILYDEKNPSVLLYIAIEIVHNRCSTISSSANTNNCSSISICSTILDTGSTELDHCQLSQSPSHTDWVHSQHKLTQLVQPRSWWPSVLHVSCIQHESGQQGPQLGNTWMTDIDPT